MHLWNWKLLGPRTQGPGGEEYPPNARADQQDGVERLESCYLGCAFSPREIFLSQNLLIHLSTHFFSKYLHIIYPEDTVDRIKVKSLSSCHEHPGNDLDLRPRVCVCVCM